MRIRTILAAAAVAVVAGLAAGCGGGASAGAGPASLGAGAAVAPADAAAFVAIDTDAGSSQWKAAEALLSKTGLLARLQQRTGVSWDDLKAALGPELDVVVLPGERSRPVLLTQPPDASKLEALLAKARGGKPVTAQVGAWTAIAETQSALDAVSGAGGRLADDSLYREATGTLSGDAFAQVYANGAAAGRLASSLGGGSARPGRVVWVAADLAASGDGVAVDGFLRSDGSAPAAQPYASTLVDRIPSGALFVADFPASSVDSAAKGAKRPAGALGAVAAALGGETALYVTPGAPIPAVTLVTQPDDPQAALDAIDRALGGATSGSGLGSLLGALHLSHEQVGSHLVVSTSQAAIDAFEGGGSKLSGDATFRQAGVPDETTGFVYANLEQTVPLLKALGGGTLPDLSSLRTLTAYGTGSTNGISGFTAFLGVR